MKSMTSLKNNKIYFNESLLLNHHCFYSSLIDKQQKNGRFLKMMTDLAEILKINKNGAEHFILF